MADVFSCESCGADIALPENHTKPFIACRICGFLAEVPIAADRTPSGLPGEPNAPAAWDLSVDLDWIDEIAPAPPKQQTQQTGANTNPDDPLFDADELDKLSSIVQPIDDLFTEPLAHFDDSDLSIGQADESLISEYTLAPPTEEVVDVSERIPDLVLQIVPSDRVFVRQFGIPGRNLKNAVESYASAVRPGDVLALFDNTSGSGDCDGFLLTRNTLHSPGRQVELLSITGAEAQKDGSIQLRLGRYESVAMQATCFPDRSASIVDLFNRIAHFNRLALANPPTGPASHFATLIKHLFPEDRTQLFHRDGEIPSAVLFGAISSYAQGVPPEDVLAIYDSSLGDGKSGMLLTSERLYYRSNNSMPPQHVDFLDISSARATPGLLKGDQLELTLTTRAKAILDMDIGKKNLSAVAQMFNQIGQSPKPSAW